MIKNRERARDVKGLTFVHFVVNSAIIRALLIVGFFIIFFAIPNFGLTQDSTLTRNLLEAVIEGDAKQIEHLLNRAENSNVPYNATELLASAAWDGRTDIMKLLLKRGAQVNPKGRFIDPPLISAVRGKGSIAAVKLLLDNGANIEIQDSCDGNTPLIQAAQMGRPEIANLLLSYGARMDAKNCSGGMALTVAAWWGKRDVVKLLLEKGALKHGPASISETALSNAAYTNHLGIVKLLRDKGVRPNLFAAICLGDVEGTRSHLEKGINRSSKYIKAYKRATMKAVERGHVEVIKLLEEAGLDIIKEDLLGRKASKVAVQKSRTKVSRPFWPKPLIVAVQKGQAEIVKQLLTQGADVNSIDSLGYTALGFAAYKGYLDIAQLLLEHGADPNRSSQTYWKPLNQAASNGHLEMVKLLLKHSAGPNGWEGGINHKLFNYRDPRYAQLAKSLIEAGVRYRPTNPEACLKLLQDMRNGYSEWLRILKDQGVELTPKLSALLGDIDGVKTYLHNKRETSHKNSDLEELLIMACKHGHPEVAALLLDNGADVNFNNRFKGNPLVDASSRGHTDIIKLLMNRGAKIDVWLYGTPLMHAAEHGQMTAVKMLLHYGKDLNAGDIGLNGALARAAEADHSDVVQTLLEHGATLDFFSAISIGDIEAIRHFIKTGADVNALREVGRDRYETPLVRASRYGRADVVKLLLDSGADIEGKDDRGNTAFLHAVFTGQTKVIKVLLDRGANINPIDDHEYNAIQWAARAGQAETVKMLLEYGVDAHNGKNGLIVALMTAVDHDNPKVVEAVLHHDAKNNNMNPAVWTALSTATKKGNREIRKLLQAHIDRFASKN